MSVVLVAIGAGLLWPPLAARHGRAIAALALVALVFGTVTWGLALGPSWHGALAFALSAGLLRMAWGREAPDATVAPWHRLGWIAALAIAAAVLVAGGSGPEDVLTALFSSWRGLLFWSPVLWLAVAGAFGGRPIGAVLLPLIVIGAAVGAVTVDAGPYRGSRFAPFLPLFAPGLARALDALRDAARNRPLLPVAVGLAVLVAWNVLLMAQYRDGGIPRDDTVSFPRVARNAAATVSRATGSPTAWPANWIFAARHGVSAARYDTLGGVDLFGPMSQAGPRGADAAEAVIDIGHLPTDEALLVDGGWSVRHPCGRAEVCRALEGRAGIRVPIRVPRDVDVSVVAFGAGTITLTLNGVAVLEARVDGASSPPVRLPAARFRRGLNSIVLSAAPADGRVLVDRIVFTPVRG